MPRNTLKPAFGRENKNKKNCQRGTSTLIILYHLKSIKQRFCMLNTNMRSCIEELGKNKNLNGEFSEAPKIWIEIYTGLTEIMDEFNDVFGWQILLIFLNSLLGILIPINSLILVAKGDFDIKYFGNVVRYIFFIVISGVFIAKVADNTYNEAKTTGLLCHKVLQNIPTDTLWMNVFKFREDMIFFTKETTMRCPKFSAAGFLLVDYSMLFVLLNSIATYVVVLIQFNK